MSLERGSLAVLVQWCHRGEESIQLFMSNVGAFSRYPALVKMLSPKHLQQCICIDSFYSNPVSSYIGVDLAAV
jgi:hypothetical protein